MANDIKQDVIFNYKTNIQTITQYHRQFSNEMQRMITVKQQWQNSMKTGQTLSYKETQLLDKQTAATKGLSTGMGSLALRFVGYNFILNQVMGMQQKLIQWVTESVDKFREFETRMAEVSTIIRGDTLLQMERLTSGVEQLSIRFGQSTSDMAKGGYDILSAAFDVRDSLNLLTTATKASIAGISEVRTSVDIFTSVLNAYGKSAAQATSISDELFQSVVRGKFQFTDLESALGYIVPIAAQAGIEFKELMAALSTTTRQGLHLDMASRGLALAIQNIISPSEKAAKAAKEYDIDMSGLALRVEGLTGFFSALNEKTKEFGKGILTELIPNMRSLRVAMVLAGDEGLEGLKDDFDLLTSAAGSTEEALSKIQDTEKFLANQITQRQEKMSRAVGEAWSPIIRGYEEVKLIWGHILGSFGNLNQAAAGYARDKKLMEDADLSYLNTLTEVGKAQEYVGALLAAESMSERITNAKKEGVPDEIIQGMVDQLNVYNSVMQNTQDSYNRLVAEVDDATEAMENHQTTLFEVEKEIDRLNDELNKSVSYGWGNYAKTIRGTLHYDLELLKAEQKQTDLQHDVKMGLIDENYQWKTNNEALKEAVALMREHEQATKKDRVEQDVFNKAIAANNLEMMKLQLRGMQRRRGLTRTEEKQIKSLQIANLQLRIEQEETTTQMNEQQIRALASSEEYVDRILALSGEQAYQMKYTYDQEITDLEDFIKDEGDLLNTRYEQWDTVYNKILSSSKDKLNALWNIMQNPALLSLMGGIGVPVVDMFTATTKFLDDMKNYQYQYSGDIPEYARGTYRVPETQMALVHKNEQIIPAGDSTKASGNKTIIQNVTIQVQQVADINDVEKLAALLSAAQSSNLATRGNTRYRPR